MSKVKAVVIDEMGEMSGHEMRQARYRESNANKKVMQNDRRQKRANKRSQAY